MDENSKLFSIDSPVGNLEACIFLKPELGVAVHTWKTLSLNVLGKEFVLSGLVYPGALSEAYKSCTR